MDVVTDRICQCFWIRNILVRIRILGSVPLSMVFGCGSERPKSYGYGSVSGFTLNALIGIRFCQSGSATLLQAGVLVCGTCIYGRSSQVWMRSSQVWMRSSQVWMRSSQVWMRSSQVWMRSSRVWVRDLAKWLELLAVSAIVASPWVRSQHPPDTLESEGRQMMKQCWITYMIRTGIHLTRIRIQHFRLYIDPGSNPDPGVLWPKNEEKKFTSKNIQQHFKTWNFIIFFYFCG